MPFDSMNLQATRNPFVGPETPTFADLIALIEKDEELIAQKRRDVLSALRTLARLIEKEPSEIPANARWLRRRLERLHPKQADISKKRFANIRSDLAFALRHAGLIMKASHLAPFTPEWRALWGRITMDRMRWNLSRFFHFCSAMQISPTAVNDCIVSDFHKALIDESLVKNSDQIYRTMVKLWNQAVETVPHWPQVRLTPPPSKREAWTLPLEAFPRSLQNDVDHWISHLRGDDHPLAENAVPRPLRPPTLKHRRFQIRIFASALVRRGHRLEEITSLAYIVDLERFKDGLRYKLERSGDRSTEAIHKLAMAIKAIARHHVRVEEDHLEKLKRICQRLKVPKHGLTEKNRSRLRQFDDPRNVGELYNLPNKLVALAKDRRRRDRPAAVLVQQAVALEILIMCPIRIGNLAPLSLEKHLAWSRPGRQGKLQLSIPPEEVKNSEPLEFELPEESALLIKLYLEKYRPLLCENPGEWLFPGRAGGHKHVGGFGQQIKCTIRRHTGLEVNAHLLRHIGAKVYLDHNPGAYEVVRRVLGHRSMDTTTAFYTGFETKAAARHFDEVILKSRTSMRPCKVRLRRRK